MRSADLTAAARIRDAAIEQFGEHGFGVGLRTIAEAAGVSAALVIHHFGSKDGLRKACARHGRPFTELEISVTPKAEPGLDRDLARRFSTSRCESAAVRSSW